MDGNVQVQEFRALDAGHSGYGCCLSPSELQDRIGQWRELAALALIDSGEDSGDLVLRYRRDSEIDILLHDLVVQETECCSALSFGIAAGTREVILRISGPWLETPWGAAPGAAAPGSESGESIAMEPGVTTGDIPDLVRRRYAAAARSMAGLENLCESSRPASGEPGPAGCGCGSDSGCGAGSGCGCRAVARIEGQATPGGLRGVSLGSGDAVGAADLREGEIVLDLGSGAGWDVLAAARRVGPGGWVLGLDMTDEMLELARDNQRSAGLDHVTFFKGQIEQIPLPAGSVDVVISNCVINLSASKPSVFAEMLRVLKPGGRVAVSDVVADHPRDAGERLDPDAWAGCIAGALTREEFRTGLESAGFRDITIDESHEVQPGYSSVIVLATTPELPRSESAMNPTAFRSLLGIDGRPHPLPDAIPCLGRRPSG